MERRRKDLRYLGLRAIERALKEEFLPKTTSGLEDERQEWALFVLQKACRDWGLDDSALLSESGAERDERWEGVPADVQDFLEGALLVADRLEKDWHFGIRNDGVWISISFIHQVMMQHRVEIAKRLSSRAITKQIRETSDAIRWTSRLVRKEGFGGEKKATAKVILIPHEHPIGRKIIELFLPEEARKFGIAVGPQEEVAEAGGTNEEQIPF